MGRLTYAMITSLDGYVNDARGEFDWAEPDEALHRYYNETARATGTHLMGRRMYETMRVWDDLRHAPDLPAHIREFAEAWADADKIVCSTTLDAVTTARTRLERAFDPDAVRSLVAASDRGVSVAGPDLAASAFRAGLVDEVELAIMPAIVGGGTRALPPGVRLDLELVEERRFPGGAVLLRYAVRPPSGT